MEETNKQYMTLREVGQYIRQSYSWCTKHWPSWTDYKVRPIRINGRPRARLLFKRKEIEQMVEKWVV